ncbi:MAG: aldo/keto reductase [Leptospirales bacterium]|nr:aldo/keto reductase [Leptospirales bacterium]
MIFRKLGAAGPAVSAVGLGCMGMSDFYGDAANRNDTASIATIRAALDAGINLFNTGDFYGAGHNEMLLARALEGRRQEAIISVKFGALRTPQGGFSGFDARPQAVKNFAAYSLRRLKTDVIDIYQPARVDPQVPIEETAGAIHELIQEGKVRFFGLSEANSEQIRRAHAVHPIAALEIEYSLGTRFVEAQILPTLRELGIPLIAYGVLSRGLLAGPLPELSPADFRRHLPRFQDQNLRHNQEKTAALQDMARKIGCTPAQLAIAWALAQGEDVIALIGTTQQLRLQENLGALSIAPGAENLSMLSSIFPDGAIAGERYPAPQMNLAAK